MMEDNYDINKKIYNEEFIDSESINIYEITKDKDKFQWQCAIQLNALHLAEKQILIHLISNSIENMSFVLYLTQLKYNE